MYYILVFTSIITQYYRMYLISACPQGKYGSNCAKDCHCPEGDSCDRVNGLCGNGTCHSDWTGAGCQTSKGTILSFIQAVRGGGGYKGR